MLRQNITIAEPMSRELELLTKVMLDPNHNVRDLLDAPPYPDEQAGDGVVQFVSQVDVDVTVIAGDSVTVMVPNSGVVALTVSPQGSTAGTTTNRILCYPHKFCDNGFPGRTFSDLKIASIRRVTSGMTATNITPALNRGGVVYGNHHAPNVLSVNTDYTVDPTVIGIGGPGSVYTNTPDTVQTTTNVLGYYAASGDEGIYMVGRPRHYRFSESNRSDTDLSVVYRGGGSAGDNPYFNGPPVIGTAAVTPVGMPYNTVVSLRSNQPDFDERYYSYEAALPLPVLPWIWAPGTTPYQANGVPVAVPSWTWDNGDCYYATMQAPSTSSQTYHIKVCGLFEVRLEPGAGSLFRGVKPEPNERFTSVMTKFLNTLPTMMPASWNDEGTQRKAILKAYNSWPAEIIKGILSMTPAKPLVALADSIAHKAEEKEAVKKAKVPASETESVKAIGQSNRRTRKRSTRSKRVPSGKTQLPAFMRQAIQNGRKK